MLSVYSGISYAELRPAQGLAEESTLRKGIGMVEALQAEKALGALGVALPCLRPKCSQVIAQKLVAASLLCV